MPSIPDPTDDKRPDGLRDRLDDLKDRIEDAAIQAEFETGEREETIEEAKAHALVRIGRMTLGTIVVLVGIVALPLPGPGWLIIAGGLTILSKDVAWADRLLRYIRKRVPGIPEDGKIPRSSLVTMALITLAAVSASLWWTLARGSDEIQAGTYSVVGVDETSEFIDTGIEITLSSEGSVNVHESMCEPVSIDVIDRSKESFVLGTVDEPDWTCPIARVANTLPGTTVDLGYSTDGIVEWFFADDALTTLTMADGTVLHLGPRT